MKKYCAIYLPYMQYKAIPVFTFNETTKQFYNASGVERFAKTIIANNDWLLFLLDEADASIFSKSEFKELYNIQ